MTNTQTIIIRTEHERIEAITRLSDARWKLVKEEPSTQQSTEKMTILTFEEEGDAGKSAF